MGDMYIDSTYILPIVFFISLFLGSFYNVVALRVVKEENIAFPPSHCVNCDHKLGVLDLVPVLSWVYLKGQCRYCNEKISKIYPFGELLTASAYTIVVWSYGLSVEALIHIITITVLIWATVSDLETMEIPDRYVVIGLLAVLPLRLMIAQSKEEIIFYLVGAVVCFAVLFVLLLVGGMGGADVKLYALIGLTIGLYGGLVSIFYASFVAVIYHLPSMINKKVEGKTAVPFVPFITVGVLMTYIMPASKLIELLS